MPLLRKEPDTFPATVFDFSVEESPWWAAHVRSRQEKALARYLRPAGVAHYLPQREHTVRRAGRRFVSFLPLFPGYLFFRGNPSDRLTALRSNLIVQVIEVTDQELLAAELLQLHLLQNAGASMKLCEPLAAGDAVRITEGPFQGYLATVTRGGERPRLVVSISILRKSVAVEIDRNAVVPIAPGGATRRDLRSAVG